MANFGMNVVVTLTDGRTRFFQNTTEVHYRFGGMPALAVESDIHSNGLTIALKNIKEFEVFPAHMYFEDAFEVYDKPEWYTPPAV